MRIIITSLAALAAFSAFAQQTGKVDPNLINNTAHLNKSQTVSVIVYLSYQPGPQIGREVRANFQPQMDVLAGQLREFQLLRKPVGILTDQQEVAFIRNQEKQPRTQVEANLVLAIDQIENQIGAQISARLSHAILPSQEAVSQQIDAMGGRVREKLTVMNAILAELPVGAIQSLANSDLVAIVANDNPGKPEMDVSVPTIGAPTFWAGSISGGGFDAGVLDTGVQQNHPAFAGKLFESNAGTADSNGHGTSMAGIMASADATFKGVAHTVGTICVAIAGNDATSMSGMNYIATGTVEKPEAVNYSFGNGTANTNDYAPIDQFFDGVIDTFGYMVSKSTGNGGFGSGTSITITHPAPAFNLMASANMNDFGTLSRTDDRISSSSSRGPTVSGRKKPDITSPGTSINSPNRTLGFTAVTGTSPASPHTGGSIILLKNAGVVDIRAAKALLLNNTDAINDNETSTTADDTWVNGSLWNKRYGWGYINLTKTFAHVTDYFMSTFAAPTSTQRRFKLYKGPMNAFDKATLVWNRHVAFGGAAYPTLVEGLSNLDLICYNRNTNGFLAQSVSAIDNVEQLSVTTANSVVLKVMTTGLFDPQVTNETFALATEEGFSVATGPVFDIQMVQLGDYVRGGIGDVLMRVRNVGDLPCYGNSVTLSNVSVVGGATKLFGTIQPGSFVDIYWQVNVPLQAGDYALEASVVSNSYGETFTGFGNGSFDVLQ